MEDLKQTGAAGALETLAAKIPGYTGYKEAEGRRDADRLHREFLARGVTALKKKVQNLQQDLLDAKDFKNTTKLDDLNNQLDRIAEKLRHANYGYSGFFEQHQVNADELSRVYEFDLNLANNLSSADEALTGLSATVGAEGFPARFTDLRNAIQQLSEKLDERERLLKGVQ
jgi:hypothetical protein